MSKDQSNEDEVAIILSLSFFDSVLKPSQKLYKVPHQRIFECPNQGEFGLERFDFI